MNFPSPSLLEIHRICAMRYEETAVESKRRINGNKLKVSTEIVFENDIDDDFSSEDDVPLSQIWKTLTNNSPKSSAKKKIKKIYQWVKDDLRPILDHFDEEVYETQNGPLQRFLNFFDEDFIQMIVTESNKYAQQRNRKTNIKNFEVKSFIGVLLFSGYVQVPRRRMLWEREQDTYNKLIAESISRDRFEYILSYIHLADNTNLDQSDKFAKVGPLFDHLKYKFIEYAPIDHCL
ncbi:Transposase IS4 [Popillia japonica]|uniref:Transposase IS4 n=1 Tax=Popillia japonica TaxID=7064 RepID=A0AAW1M151_POPJA